MAQYLLFEAEMFLRMILAGLCGALIGYERKNRGKGAGIRTHLVVATAAALMMLVSKYGFSDVSQIVSGNVGEFRLDPSRIASQIVSGIGFLGAGMIYIHRKTAHGLTTAAGVWATAGIGMAIGSGMYITGILASALIVISQTLLHKDFKFLKTISEEYISFTIDESKTSFADIKNMLDAHDIQLESVRFKRLNETMTKIEFWIVATDFKANELMLIAKDNDSIFEMNIGKDSLVKMID